MKIIKIDLKNLKSEDLSLIISYLEQGKVIAYPSDTIYGLGCRADNKKAINKIYKIKQREKNKPLLILIKSYCMLKDYFFVSIKQDKYIRKFWGKNNNFDQKKYQPTTFILKDRGLLPKELNSGAENMAVRLPKSEFLIKIIKSIKVPLVSTSLNITGQPDLKDPNQALEYFKGVKPDLIISAGILPLKPVSKIINLQDINNIKILR